MIRVDIPLPICCQCCPMSYWIQTGPNEGRLMCEAIESRDGGFHDGCLVPATVSKRPDDCPIKE